MTESKSEIGSLLIDEAFGLDIPKTIKYLNVMVQKIVGDKGINKLEKALNSKFEATIAR